MVRKGSSVRVRQRALADRLGGGFGFGLVRRAPAAGRFGNYLEPRGVVLLVDGRACRIPGLPFPRMFLVVRAIRPEPRIGRTLTEATIEARARPVSGGRRP